MLQHAHIRSLPHGLRQQRLYILTIDLQIAPAPRHVLPLLVLLYDEAELLDVAGDVVQAGRQRAQQVLADDAGCVAACILHVILGRMPRRYIGVQRIHTGRQASAALDPGFVSEQHLEPGMLLRQRDGGIAACRASAYDQDVRLILLYIHLPRSSDDD